MVISVSIFELHLPAARSLKEKRKVIKGLIERIHHRFRVSIAETGFHDLHQRSEISIAAISRSPADGERLMSALREMVDALPEAVLTHWDPQLLEGVR